MLDNLNTKEELNAFAHAVIKQSRANLTRQGKKSSGNLHKNLGFDLEVYKNSFSLQFLMEDYGEFVDKGVSGTEKKYNTKFTFRDKMPPKVEILKWVKQRRLRLRDEKGRFKKGGQNSLAFLIQRKIYRKGIKPSLYFTKPFEAAFKNLPPELEKAFALDVEKLMEQTLQDGRTN